MTRYNDGNNCLNFEDLCELDGYREGVDRVIEYVASIQVYPKLTGELKWAIEQGII